MGKLVTGGDMIASEAKYHPGCLLALYSKANKCIGNDTTKAAAHQSPNCIKKTINKIRRGLCRHAVRQCLSVCHVRRFRGVNGGGMGDASPPPNILAGGCNASHPPLLRRTCISHHNVTFNWVWTVILPVWMVTSGADIVALHTTPLRIDCWN